MPSETPESDLWSVDGPDLVIQGDNLEAMRRLPDGAFQVVYLDPPFNTGKTQRRQSIRVKRSDRAEAETDAGGAAPAAADALADEPVVETPGLGSAASAAEPLPAPGSLAPGSSEWTRTGFQGRSYAQTLGMLSGYSDSFADYWGFLEPRLVEAWRLLDDSGTLYLHLDYREAHYAKVVLDALVGRDCFLNEIVWAYDYGGRSNRKWPAKHDTILVYVKDPDRYFFDSAEVDREPYMAPGLVTPEKAARGKLPTDVWWHTIVSPTGKERTGFATQKPEGIVRRMIQASSVEGDWIADFFGGSGTTAAAARALGRRVVTVDSDPHAFDIMRERLGADGIEYRKLHGTGSRLLSASPVRRRVRPSEIAAKRAGKAVKAKGGANGAASGASGAVGSGDGAANGATGSTRAARGRARKAAAPSQASAVDVSVVVDPADAGASAPNGDAGRA